MEPANGYGPLRATRGRRSAGNAWLGAACLECFREAPRRCSISFFDAWCCGVWDTKLVNEATGFHVKGESVPVVTFMKQHCEAFYSGLMKETAPDPARAQSQTPVRTMAPIEIADDCSRVSLGSGLPEDGHLTRAAFQGQCVYYWKGACSELQNPLLEESESRWDVGAPGPWLTRSVTGEAPIGARSDLRLDALGFRDRFVDRTRAESARPAATKVQFATDC